MFITDGGDYAHSKLFFSPHDAVLELAAAAAAVVIDR